MILLLKELLHRAVIGPPEHKEDDEKFFRSFFSKCGSHIVCGGSSMQAAARFLKKKVKEGEIISPDVPAIYHIDGIDLATEGLITLRKLLELADIYVGENSIFWDLPARCDAASCLLKMLFEEATDVFIYVGQAINPAHQQAGIGIDFDAKMIYIKQLKDRLKKAGKTVTIKMV